MLRFKLFLKVCGLKWWDGERDIAVDGVYLHGIGKWDKLYVDGRRSIKEGLYFGFKTLTGLKDDFDVIDCQEFPYFPCFSAKIYILPNESQIQRGDEMAIDREEINALLRMNIYRSDKDNTTIKGKEEILEEIKIRRGD